MSESRTGSGEADELGCQEQHVQRPWGRGEPAAFDAASEEPGRWVGAVALVQGDALDKGGGTGGGERWTQSGRRQRWRGPDAGRWGPVAPSGKEQGCGEEFVTRVHGTPEQRRGCAPPGARWPWKSRGRGGSWPEKRRDSEKRGSLRAQPRERGIKDWEEKEVTRRTSLPPGSWKGG